MSDILQAKTITGEYSGFADSALRAESANFLTAVPTGYATTADLTGKQDTLTFGYNESNAISSINESAIAAGGATYGYTDNSLISAIDSSGLYATSGSANHLINDGTMGGNIIQTKNANYFYYMPTQSPWTTADAATGIFSPLQYSTGACLAMDAGSFKAYFKGNEWFVSNPYIGQMLRGETHQSRGVHITGATTAGNGFNLGISGVSGINSTANNYNWILQRGYVSGKGVAGEWSYGPSEDAALRAVSSCDMHESAFEYDANDNISGYNGSAFACGGTDSSNTFTIISGVTTNKEVAENSGKGLLFRDGQGYTYTLAGKATYSTYAIYDFRTMTGNNTCKQCRVKVYPTATSATTAYTTGYTTMLTTNDSVNYANTAYTAMNDEYGRSIAGLYDFVSQNSGSWTGGGGDTGTSIPLRIDYQYAEQYGYQSTSYSLSSDGSNFVFTAYDNGYQPNDLYINGYNYSWSYNNGRWEISHQINGQESVSWSDPIGLQYSGQDIIGNLPVGVLSTALNKVVVNNLNGSITGNISLRYQGSMMPYTSFTGSWSGEIPTSYNSYPITAYDVIVGPEYYGNDYAYVIGAYSEAGGTTVNSADVFPSTDNLNPYSTYRLCWNASNGGLYWEQGGN